MLTFNHMLKFVTGTLAASLMMASQAVTMSQTPLLTQAGSVVPNMMLIFDDSGSMVSQSLYQYGGTAGGYGMTGPGGAVKLADCSGTLDINNTCIYQPFVPVATPIYPTFSSSQNYANGAYVKSPLDSNIYVCTRSNRNGACSASTIDPSIDTLARWDPYVPPSASIPYYELSPDVNRLHYDPRVRYRLRLKSDGTTTTAASPVSSLDFYVFLYQQSNLPAVWGGTSGENNPTLLSSYFSNYTPATALLDPDPSTVKTNSYPNCVGKTVCPSSGAGPFPKFLNRTDCNGGAPGGSCSLAEEQQNYANWKKFHSNRLDLVKTGLGYAFQDVIGNLRIGWSVFSDLGNTGFGAGTPVTVLGSNGSGVALLDQTRKNTFYDWLYSRDATSDTPTRESLIAVGKYFSRADSFGPWADTPDPTSKGLSTPSTSGSDTAASRLAHASCRRSYALLTTDGYYNDYAPALEDTDYTAITAITGYKPDNTALPPFNYDGRKKPYAQASSYTSLADIAMKYWITDLRTDLRNNVPTSVNNESFWQNLGFYAVGLGINGTLTQTQATLDSITSGTISWPSPPSGGNAATTIDDMWHATVNARGRMLSAKDADALSDGVEGMLAEITKIESSQSGVAASTLSLNTSTKKYTPNYTTGTWTGNVLASQLDPSSGAEKCIQWRVTGSWLTDPTDATKKHWYLGGQLDGTPDLAPCSGAPTSFSGITYSGRNIYAWNGSAMGSFDSSNSYVTSSTTGVASASGVIASANLVNYLRGDQSKEDILDARGQISTTNVYRARQFILGDIVNSTPTFIQGALNMNYDKLPVGTFGQASYSAFLTAKAARAEGVLFAGSNDGMLHGFRDSTGAEVFAFVPRAVMPKMSQLASRSYNHQYYVDGTTIEADACLTGGSSCTTWTNMLLGSAGAGAKTVFALDVTNPTSMTAASVMWEITTASSGFANLGHLLTDVQTGVTPSGDWVAVFGNGYNGADGVAHLYVANLKTGALIRDISTGASGGNGLGGVRLVRDANQRIIGAYAGDLMGNLWKFDLSNTNSSSWGLGLSGSPLYAAGSGKPITAPPAVVTHPNGGVVVSFGTGKLFETTDTATTSTQTLYGLWDSVAFGSTSTPAGVVQTGTSKLVQQSISAAITGTNIITNADLTTTSTTINYYSVSRNPVDWTTKRGWYIDLPNTGQRVTNPIEALVGSIVAIDTVSPANVSTNPCVQTGTGKAWNYVIDAVTGSGPSAAIFDTNGSRTVTSADLLVSGYENSADGRTRYIKNDAQSTPTSTAFTPLSTQQLPQTNISCIVSGTCATVTGVVRRSWRQLFLR